MADPELHGEPVAGFRQPVTAPRIDVEGTKLEIGDAVDDVGPLACRRDRSDLAERAAVFDPEIERLGEPAGQARSRQGEL